MARYCDTLLCWQRGKVCKCQGYYCDDCTAKHECKTLPHGHVLGQVGEVLAHNCHYDHIEGDYDHLNYVRSRRGSIHYTGDKWQCVEFARRWWLSRLDVYLPDVPRACEIWERKFVKRLEDAARVDLQKFPNGKSPVPPAVDDLVIWQRSEEQPPGHVAVVVEVTKDKVRVAEQNARNNVQWLDNWSREFPLVFNQGVYTIDDSEDEILGWVRVDHSKALPRIPWTPPEEDRTAVDGDYGTATATFLQKFLGVRPDGQHGRFTDFALAAFLNTHMPEHPHVKMAALGKDMDRTPLIRKLQAFLLEHPLISGAGTEEVEIKENGEWDAATVKGLQNLLNRVTFADEFKQAAAVYKSGGGPPPRPNLPHGVLLGTTASGVNSYNCNYANMPPLAEGEVMDMQNYVQDSRGNSAFSGLKWQCVEFARRWWITKFDVTLENVPRACDIWSRKTVKRLSDKKPVALKMYATGESTEPPAVGDLIIWVRTDEQPVGHVAVVAEVTDTYVRIAEQNVRNSIIWEGGYSREFPLQRDSVTGAYTLRDDEDPLFGWVRVFPDQVVDIPPWTPIQPRLAVDGKFEGPTLEAWREFVGLNVKRDMPDLDLSNPRWAGMVVRMTDFATAAFLNVAHLAYPHVPVGFFMSYVREPVVKKLQNFLTVHPEFSGVGPDLVIAETGEWDEATTRGVQNLLNKIDHYEDFEAALAYLRK